MASATSKVAPVKVSEKQGRGNNLKVCKNIINRCHYSC